jgi:hypothetical protein
MLKMRLRKMKIIGGQLMESTKVSFGCNSNLGAYATSMSDIPKLYEINLVIRNFNHE